jgi:hypothetical protein
VIPIPEFVKPDPLTGAFADAACDPIVTDAESLGKATSEPQVADTVRKVRAAVGTGTCKDAAKLAKVNEWLAKTVYLIPDRRVVREGVEIVLTVTRGENIWTLVVSGGPRGLWLTTYGVSIVPSRDEPHFAKSVGDDKFVITAETEIDDVRMIPSIFFSWLPRKRMLGDFAFGPTAGLGLTKDKAAVFGGVGVTYNWNLAFIAGAAVSPHTRLNGRYTAGQEVGEALSDDQVNRQAFRPTWLIALTFRFAGNPFGGGDDGGGESEETEQNGEAAKKQQEAEAEKKKEQGEAEKQKPETGKKPPIE